MCSIARKDISPPTLKKLSTPLLVETIYRENDKRKVSIVAHSMGAPLMLHFFTESGVVNQAWKNKYIGNFIPVTGA